MSPQEIPRIITDVQDEKVKNYFRHVLVVELPTNGEVGQAAALPLQVWGQQVIRDSGGTGAAGKRRVDFGVDIARALGAPFVLPTGGNPLCPQGSYGVPVYPCWLVRQDKKSRELISFASLDEVYRFLKGRVARTTSLRVSEQLLGSAARAIAAEIGKAHLTNEEKALGIIVLVQVAGQDSSYQYAAAPSAHDLGANVLCPGRYIVPNFTAMLEQAWAAKLAESAQKGEKEGTCSFYGAEGHVVSPYCKAWPWALPEWNCPLPYAGREEHWIEGVALCESCCRALTLGARVFDRLSCPLHRVVVRELFSPVSDGEARRAARQRNIQELRVIRGSGYVLPVLDEAGSSPEFAEAYADGIQAMLSFPARDRPLAEQYLDSVTGFDLLLPEEFDKGEFRVTLA